MGKSTEGGHFANAPEKKRSKRGPVIALFVILAVLVAIYLGGVAYFNFFFMPSTTVDGQDVSLMSVEDVAKSLAATKTAATSPSPTTARARPRPQSRSSTRSRGRSSWRSTQARTSRLETSQPT